ncbi:MAG: hypothetical protein WCR72_01790 [Bacteroidota bacterium]
MTKYRYIIGIDPGTNTGLAIWDSIEKKLLSVRSCKIHAAFDFICNMHNDETLIRIEDARLRKWYGKNTKGKDQGAGGIKRDCSIWEDFLKDNGFNFEMVDPKHQTTKLSSEQFKKMTGWEGTTNEHGRDAGMLVFNHK